MRRFFASKRRSLAPRLGRVGRRDGDGGRRASATTAASREGLTGQHDPDWWIRRKIEREQLTGLGPPALTLRVENAELEDRLDRMHRESEVREAVEDFNRRVIEARRQLLGGPPVVTPTRDAGGEVRAWRERREARQRKATEEREQLEHEQRPSRARWWKRRD